MIDDEYHKKYQMYRLRERLPIARERLGECCATCGATESLEFDHIDPKTKEGNISEIANWSLLRFLKEVDKCQLLCRACHAIKTAQDQGYGDHNNYSAGKRNCKCEICIEKRRSYHREYMRRYRYYNNWGR